MSVYTKIAIGGAILFSFLMFTANIIENKNTGMSAFELKQIVDGNEQVTYGAPGQSITANNSDDHTLRLDIPLSGELVIPYVGEILFFISTLLSIIWMVLTTIFSFITEFALLSTHFPVYASVFIAPMQLVWMFSIYKVLWPGE